jgi:hypothetical protein
MFDRESCQHVFTTLKIMFKRENVPFGPLVASCFTIRLIKILDELSGFRILKKEVFELMKRALMSLFECFLNEKVTCENE